MNKCFSKLRAKREDDWVRQSNHTIHNQYCTAGAEGAVGEFVQYWSAELEKKMMKEPNCSDPREVEIRLEWTRPGGENEKSNLTQFPKKSVTRDHYLQKGSSCLWLNQWSIKGLWGQKDCFGCVLRVRMTVHSGVTTLLPSSVGNW